MKMFDSDGGSFVRYVSAIARMCGWVPVCVCVCEARRNMQPSVCMHGSMHRIGATNSCEHEPEQMRTSTFWRCCPCDVIVLHPKIIYYNIFIYSDEKKYYFRIPRRSLRLVFLLFLSLSLPLSDTHTVTHFFRLQLAGLPMI